MFKQILVPLDGSVRAEKALPVAVCLARAAGGRVTLLQAVYPHQTAFMESVGEIVLPNILDEKAPVAREYLEVVATKSSLKDIRTTKQVVIGHPAQAIIAAVNEDKADLVVMCSHGYTGVTRWSLGSIAEKVARYAPSPVLILHEGSALLSEEGAVPHSSTRVLVPLDGSEYAETAIVPAALLASTLSGPTRAELHLTRVVSTEMGSFDEAVERTEQYLRSVAELVQGHLLTDTGAALDLSVTWSVMPASDTASGILQTVERAHTARDEGFQVIAMTTHGLGGSQQWAMGSTTERVMQVIQQPLLIVRR